MNQHIFLTGATGYIGRHILASLLQQGMRVTVLLRRRKGLLEARLARIFDSFPNLHQLDLENLLSVVEGDVSETHCGLSEESISRLKKSVNLFLHCAGMTCFDQEKESEIRRQNVDGTRNAYETAVKLGIPHFFYVSTAFVAGDHPDLFTSQDLNLGQGFKNAYEKSKFDAEMFLHSRFSDRKTVISIFRPSIVVGGNVIGESQTMTTIYAFLKSLHFIRECCSDDLKKDKKLVRQYGMRRTGSNYFIPMRFACNPETGLNLVSVFHLTGVLSEKIKNLSSISGVYDILGSRQISIREAKETFCRVLGLEGIELVSPEAWKEKNKTPIEERFFRGTRVYEPYLYSSPRFQLNSSPGVDPNSISLESMSKDFLRELEKYTDRKASPRLNALALSCLSVEDPGRYLDRFSDKDFGDSFLKRIQFVKAHVLFRVTGDRPAEKLVDFDLGNVRNADSGNGKIPDFGYEMDEETFQLIVHGVLDPREALFQGKLKLLGDQAMCLKLGYIFSEHFRNINERILEELVET